MGRAASMAASDGAAIREGATITEIMAAAQTLVRDRMHRLMVSDISERVLGILSTIDLLQASSAE
jgi:CBS-domain-containing membrane protein